MSALFPPPPRLGHLLRAVARHDVPVRLGVPAGDTERRVWEIAFGLMVRRRFTPESPLAEIGRSVATAVNYHAAAALPALDAEMLVREALGEKVPVDDIDETVRAGVHLLLSASLADELAMTDGELDGLVRQAEELAVAVSAPPPEVEPETGEEEKEEEVS
ncbi:hypothetical protein AB0J83_34680 [Actinoplanes sp. NPDC049596]|uniref:hypothetical protein n=1 Tax=unclassified Actinoplanes TaxID=2626549 RepID=UPI003444C5EB